MWKLSIYEYESYKVMSETWYWVQFKTSRLDYNKQLKHTSVGYAHIKIQKSTSRYWANYPESKKQSFHHSETDKLKKKQKSIIKRLSAMLIPSEVT